MEENTKLESEKVEENLIEKKKPNKRLFVIVGAIVVVLAILFIFVFIPLIRKSKYRGEVGEIITMGKYEQDGDETNGAEDIQWLIIKKEGDKELVVSLKALDAKPYNSASDEDETTWETCSLRTWVSESFVPAVFSEKELVFVDDSKIESKEVLDKSSYTGYGSFSYSTDNKGKDSNITYTTDKVFPLSYNEIIECLENDDSRICYPTQALVKKGALYTKNIENSCDYWLRDSKYYEYNWNYSGFLLRGNTTLNKAYGMYVKSSGTASEDNNWSAANSSTIAFRPAMWLNLE